LIGNNVVNLSASALATVIVQKHFENLPISLATGILTLVILIFGEIIPKNAASLYADTIAMAYAPIIYALCIILTPVIFILNKVSRGFMRLLHINPDRKNAVITEDELLTVIDVSHEEGVIESKERDMIENVVDFGDSRAKDIMVPRIDVEFVEDTATYKEIQDKFIESNFSRLPVFHETTDNVIGILFLKDFFKFNETPEAFDIKKAIRKPYLTFEYKKTTDLLAEMRQKKISISVVLDEYGATAGVITIEDLLEEIVGELRDEYDFDETDLITKISENEYLVDGSAKIDEVNEITGLEINEDEIDYDSIAGYVINLLERIPEENDWVTDNKAKYVVKKVDRNRIESLLYLQTTSLRKLKPKLFFYNMSDRYLRNDFS
jgi:CBS domain containing-hemolysin-like protein